MFCFTPGTFPSELPGLGAVSSNGPTLPVLLLCPFGHLLVCGHLLLAGRVASDPSEESQQ